MYKPSFFDNGLSPHQRYGLDFTVFDRLKWAFDDWIETNRMIYDSASENELKGESLLSLIGKTPYDENGQLKQEINFSQYVHDFNYLEALIWEFDREDKLLQEIESNLMSNISEDKIVFYLGKLIDLHNEIFDYIEYSLHENLNAIVNAFGNEHKQVEAFGVTSLRLGDKINCITNCINKGVSHSLWYKRHEDITRLKDRRNTTLPAHRIDISNGQGKVEPITKLRWNGTNDSLYDLFAQLSLISVSTNKPLLDNTIEGLAQFLSTAVEGMPSVETIERRIRSFREPQGQQPKRGRIELHINKENP